MDNVRIFGTANDALVALAPQCTLGCTADLTIGYDHFNRAFRHFRFEVDGNSIGYVTLRKYEGHYVTPRNAPPESWEKEGTTYGYCHGGTFHPGNTGKTYIVVEPHLTGGGHGLPTLAQIQSAVCQAEQASFAESEHFVPFSITVPFTKTVSE